MSFEPSSGVDIAAEPVSLSPLNRIEGLKRRSSVKDWICFCHEPRNPIAHICWGLKGTAVGPWADQVRCAAGCEPVSARVMAGFAFAVAIARPPPPPFRPLRRKLKFWGGRFFVEQAITVPIFTPGPVHQLVDIDTASLSGRIRDCCRTLRFGAAALLASRRSGATPRSRFPAGMPRRTASGEVFHCSD